MSTALRGAVVIVTGASRGLGRAVAAACGREGATSVLVARRAEPLEQAAAELRAAGAVALAVPADISRYAEAERVVAVALEHYGRVDVLVNNAGVGVVGLVENADPADWERMLDVNFKGTAFCSKAVLPTMLERGRGDIVNIASAGGTHGIANWSGYCASKFAVRGFAQALAQEVAGRGVRVATLCPGGIETPFWDDLNEPYPGGADGRAQIMSADSVADMVLAVLDQPRNVLLREAVFFPVNEWH